MSSTAVPLSVSSTTGAMPTEATVSGSWPTWRSSRTDDVLSTSAPALATRAPQPKANASSRVGSASNRSSHRNAGTTTPERQRGEDEPEQRGLHARLEADGRREDQGAEAEAHQEHRQRAQPPHHRAVGGVDRGHDRSRRDPADLVDLRPPGLSPRHAPQASRSRPLYSVLRGPVTGTPPTAH